MDRGPDPYWDNAGGDEDFARIWRGALGGAVYNHICGFVENGVSPDRDGGALYCISSAARTRR